MPQVAPNRRLLIVDDNPTIHEDFRKIFCTNLATSEALASAEAALFGEAESAPDEPPFQVDSAFQGQEALERLRTALKEGERYAVAFVDIRMPPGWDGVETAERLWQEDPDLQIVLCTAYSDYAWDEVRARLGRSDRLLVLKKPFDNIEALQLADALTEKWRLTQQERARVANLQRLIEACTRDLESLKAEVSSTHERYRLLVERTSAMPWELDRATWRALYLSPKIRAIVGLAADVGKSPDTFLELLHPEDRDAFKEFVTNAVREYTGATHIDSRLPTPGQGLKYIRSFVCAQSGASERTVCGISVDVTQQKHLELERAQGAQA
jgi:CheY-like chemotaxis protein